MKNMKSVLFAGALLVGSSAMAQSYNRVGLSYNSDHYGYNKEYYGNDKENDPSFNSYGFGLNYIHGFSLHRTLPMYLEVGGNMNFGFKNTSENMIDEGIRMNYKTQFQNINLRIPVSFAWKFNVANNFYITPYTGINFKFNFITKSREGATVDGKTVWTDWVNVLKENKEYGIEKADTWNIFQMGWHLGATFGWKQFSLGLECGVDFIPAYKETVKFEGLNETYKVNNSTFKLTLGYEF